MKMIDSELVRKLFHYDYVTGEFRRIGRLKSNGTIATCDFVGSATSTHGYLQYTIKNKTYDVHRLIFLYIDGVFPDCDIDHIDGNRRNNAFSNLRKVSRSENLRNVGKKTTNKSGRVGVGFDAKTNKWRVWIQSDFYGGFDTFEQAVAFRIKEETARGFSEQHYVREIWNEN